MRAELLQRLQDIVQNPGVYRFLSDEELSELLLSLIELGTRRVEVVPGPQGEPGLDGITPTAGVDYLSRREQEEMIRELVAAVEVRDGNDGVDGADADITDDDIQAIVQAVYEAIDLPLAINQSPEEIRNALELLQDDERLDKSAVRGIDEIEEKLDRIEKRSVSGGGLSTKAVQNLIDASLPSSTPLDATLTYTGSQLTQVTTSAGDTDLTYSGSQLTSVALPDGTTATLTYTGTQLTGVSYS